jgi:AMP deaminase
MSRIDRYTARTGMATPTATSSKPFDQNPYISQQRPVSPTSPMKTNASASTVPVESVTQSYQQYPAQAARVPTSHSQVHLDGQVPSTANASPLLHGKSHEQPPIKNAMTSPHLSGKGRESSWPVEGFGDLHLSGSEPRIFPGVVSRTQRRDSLVRQSSMSETDDHVNVGMSGKGKGAQGKNFDVAVEEEESDGEMEEAGGHE